VRREPKNVAAGILPAVEGGILPPGKLMDRFAQPENFKRLHKFKAL
jgi:hypothetical protein